MRPDNGGEARAQGGDNSGGIVHRQGGLGDISQLFGVAGFQCGDILGGFDQQNLAVWQLAHRADRFRVTFVTDHHHLQTVLMMAFGLDMDLGYQRAGGVDIDHLAARGLGGDGFRNTMRREDDRTIIRAFVQFLDKHRTLGAQPIHNEFVVHDFMPHIDRRTPFLDRHFDDLDGAIHTSAKAVGGCKIKGQGGFGHGVLRSGSEVRVFTQVVQSRTPKGNKPERVPRPVCFNQSRSSGPSNSRGGRPITSFSSSSSIKLSA